MKAGLAAWELSRFRPNCNDATPANYCPFLLVYVEDNRPPCYLSKHRYAENELTELVETKGTSPSIISPMTLRYLYGDMERL
jgi:hypothetical protein